MNTKQLLKGNSETIILASLQHSPKHGYAISQWVKEESHGAFPFSAGMLYPLLHKMEKRKLINARWVESERGPRRKEYSITPRGKKILQQSTQNWHTFVSLIQHITEPSRSAL
jgi:PadR family transcriptional regulator PadR